jgi:hypothetical protein
MRARGFVTNEYLNVIAIVAVWVGISFPIYGVVVKSVSRGGMPTHGGTHLLALIAAGLVPPALLLAMCGLERVVEFGWQQIKSRGTPE